MLCISAGALSKMGSTGKEVSDIQSRLQSLGYYTGKIDGIYGIATKNAVVNFQKANGLVADGVVPVSAPCRCGSTLSRGP